MKFQCPNCSQHLEADEEMAGMQVDCPSCSTKLDVPTNRGQSSSVPHNGHLNVPPPLPSTVEVVPALPPVLGTSAGAGATPRTTKTVMIGEKEYDISTYVTNIDGIRCIKQTNVERTWFYLACLLMIPVSYGLMGAIGRRILSGELEIKGGNVSIGWGTYFPFLLFCLALLIAVGYPLGAYFGVLKWSYYLPLDDVQKKPELMRFSWRRFLFEFLYFPIPIIAVAVLVGIVNLLTGK